MNGRRLYLAASVNSTGWLGESWSWPGTRWNRFSDYGHYVRCAQLAHDGTLDAIFVSDHTALQKDNRSRPLHSFDPIVLFSALAAGYAGLFERSRALRVIFWSYEDHRMTRRWDFT
jgi:hypothetical protein